MFFHIFFGIEHRTRRKEMEEQFSRETKQAWKFAADVAVITNDNAGREDCKHASSGVFVAINNDLGADTDKETSCVRILFGNEGRILQAWVIVRGGMRVFAVYFWYSEGWTPRNEGFMEAVVETDENRLTSVADGV